MIDRENEFAVVLDAVTKAYNGRTVVDGLSFAVHRGEIFALLGPNGAGKTTTVEMMEGYRAPDSGSITVLGLDPVRQGTSLKARIGAMPQEGGLYPSISPREALNLFASFYEHSETPDSMLRLVGLESSAGTRYRRLSGGQKQRLSLALALIGRPELVFLDEPTAGLDAQARRTTWDIIRELRDQNITVILTTHYLEEVERLADRVAIIDEGRMVMQGTPDALVRGDTSRIRVRTTGPVQLGALLSLSACQSAESPEPCVYVLTTDDPPLLLVQVTTLLRDYGSDVMELRVGESSLEDVFLQLTQHELAS